METKQIPAFLLLSDVKKYLRIDGNDDDQFISACIDGCKFFVLKYTGLTEDDLKTNKNDDLTNAMLALIADMYELRQATVSGVQLNPYVEMILNMNQRNLM